MPMRQSLRAGPKLTLLEPGTPSLASAIRASSIALDLRRRARLKERYRSAFAVLATLSAVKPNSSKQVLPEAEAP
ncbi:MAG TPA: hypothetical protein PLB21_12410, partial [Actinomycetota bacterium]|nr:hypothetical protein [Actinomycetota bacterium]